MVSLVWWCKSPIACVVVQIVVVQIVVVQIVVVQIRLFAFRLWARRPLIYGIFRFKLDDF